MVTGEDNVVQHYAVQALDNLATQLKGDHSGAAARLASLRTFEVLSSLYNLMQDSKIEPLRATASSALSRIVRFQPSLGAQLVDKVGLSAVTELLGDDNARVQQAFINVLNVVLTSPSQRTLKALDQHQPQLLTAILALLDHELHTRQQLVLLPVQHPPDPRLVAAPSDLHDFLQELIGVVAVGA